MNQNMNCSSNNTNKNKVSVLNQAILSSTTSDDDLISRNLSIASEQQLSTGTNCDLRTTAKSQDKPKRQETCAPPREDSGSERLSSACSTTSTTSNEQVARAGESAKSNPQQVAANSESHGQGCLPNSSYSGTLPLKDSLPKKQIKNKEVSFLKYAKEILRSLDDDESDDEDDEDHLMSQ